MTDAVQIIPFPVTSIGRQFIQERQGSVKVIRLPVLMGQSDAIGIEHAFRLCTQLLFCSGGLLCLVTFSLGQAFQFAFSFCGLPGSDQIPGCFLATELSVIEETSQRRYCSKGQQYRGCHQAGDDRVPPYPLLCPLQSTNRSSQDRFPGQPVFQFLGYFFGRAITGFGSFLHAFEGDGFEIAINRWLNTAGFDRFLVQDIKNRFQGRFASKGQFTGKQFVEDGTQTINIYRRAQPLFAAGLLGCHVRRGTDDGARVGEIAPAFHFLGPDQNR